MAVETYDPLRSFKFHVEIQGISGDGEIGFQKVSGLKESSDVVEYREGNMMIHKRKLPGLTNYEPITLTRGSAASNAGVVLFDWRALTARYIDGGMGPNLLSSKGDGVPAAENAEAIGGAGGGFRRAVKIKVFDKGDPNTANREVRSWEIKKAWPSELSVSDLNAEASEMLIDTLVLQHEGLNIAKPTFQNSAS